MLKYCGELESEKPLINMLDSMSFMKLIVDIEDEFNIFIDEFDLNFENFEDVSTIVEYICTNTENYSK